MTSSTIEIDGRPGRLITAFNITERRTTLEETQRLATIDSLTGLANYRPLVEAFESERGRWQRTGRSFSLLLLDLDRLKDINDGLAACTDDGKCFKDVLQIADSRLYWHFINHVIVTDLESLLQAR